MDKMNVSLLMLLLFCGVVFREFQNPNARNEPTTATAATSSTTTSSTTMTTATEKKSLSKSQELPATSSTSLLAGDAKTSTTSETTTTTTDDSKRKEEDSFEDNEINVLVTEEQVHSLIDSIDSDRVKYIVRTSPFSSFECRRTRMLCCL